MNIHVYSAGLLLATSALSPLYAAANSGQTLETVIVSASPLSTDPNQLATIIGQVNRDQILQSGGANLADALSSVAGVTGTGFAGGASRPVVRGFADSRVRVLENGVGSFDVSDIGPDHGIPIDPLSATKIEVVRGAATLRYGSQAIGGIVNAVNNRVPLDLPDAADPIGGEITGTYGSVNDARQASGLIDARAGQFAIHADGFDRQTGNYDIPHGTQANSYFKGDGYSLGSSYFFGANNDSRAGAALMHFDSDYGVPSDITHIVMKQTKGVVGSSFAINEGALNTLTMDAGYGDYAHDEDEPDGTVDDTFKDREWDSRAEGLFGAVGPFDKMALGVQLGHRDFEALGAGADYLLPTNTKSYAGFFFGESALADKLKLQVGARAEQSDLKGTPSSGIPASPSFTPLSASAGVVYDSSEALTFGATLTSAARAPAVTELFAHGPHDGPNTFETGDPNLKAERANSLEGTVRWRTPTVQAEGALWSASFDNFIYGALTGRMCDDAGVCAWGGSGDFKQLFYQQSGATFRGAEGKLTVALLTDDTGTLNADAQADYVRATLSGGGNVPRIPPYHVGGGLSWMGESIGANVQLTYTGSQHELAVAETPTKGFVSVDAGLTWRPDPANSDISVSLTGKNLTNTTQRSAVSINKDDVVLPGRDIRLLLRYGF